MTNSPEIKCPFCGAGHTARHSPLGFNFVVCSQAPSVPFMFYNKEPVKRCGTAKGYTGPDLAFCTLPEGHKGKHVFGKSWMEDYLERRRKMEQERSSKEQN